MGGLCCAPLVPLSPWPLASFWDGPRLLLLAEVSAINHQPNPALAGWREAEEGDSQEIRVPVVCKCRPMAQGYVLGHGSALGSWLPGQLLSPWGGPESSGPVLEPGMAGGGTCREASEGGQREMPRTPSWVAVIPRLIWGPWIFPMRKGNWSWRVGPLRALVDFETQHLVMFFSYDL